MLPDSGPLIFFVNGQKIEDREVDPRWTLLEYLRRKLQLYGTKLACGQGGCGSCTVMISRLSPLQQQIHHFSVTACLIPICTVHGCSVITVEGLGSSVNKLHPIQERLAKANGSQCGFCSPGFVMSMYALLRNNPQPSYQQLEEQLQGNLCRCTGYRPILEGFKSFLGEEQGKQTQQDGAGCCKGKQMGCCQSGEVRGEKAGCCSSFVTEDVSSNLLDNTAYAPYDPTQEILFPPYLQLHPELSSMATSFSSDTVKWFSPNSIEDLLELRCQHPEAQMLGGCNAMVQELKGRKSGVSIYITGCRVADLHRLEFTDKGLVIGAEVTATTLQTFLRKEAEEGSETKRYIPALLKMIYQYACKQTRNTACVGSIVMTNLESVDFVTLLMSLQAAFMFQSKRNLRSVTLSSSQHPIDIIHKDEVLVSVFLPHTHHGHFIQFYKQATRETCSPAIVSAAFSLEMDYQRSKIKNLTISYGGIINRTWKSTVAADAVKDKEWDDQLTEKLCEQLAKELSLGKSTPGGHQTYRMSLALSLLFKFSTEVLETLDQRILESPFEKEILNETVPRSSHVFQKVPQSQPDIDPIGRPIIDLWSYKQTCGEVEYVVDTPPVQGQLHAAPVLSTCALGEILEVDATDALQVEGVKGFFSAKDLTEDQNNAIVGEATSPIFAPGKVEHHGQLIGVIIAEDRRSARAAAELVKVKYQEHSKPILTIQEAIEHQSFFEPKQCLQKGDVESAMAESECVLEGEVYQGGQIHMYMEPLAAVVTPKDANEVDVWVGAQCLESIQTSVAKLLNIPANHVSVHSRRIGGSFGGKETAVYMVVLPAVIAAKKFRKSVRFVMDRDENIKLSGGRHPYITKYKVGFSKMGQLSALEIEFFSNGGYTVDMSPFVAWTAMMQTGGAYNFPNMKVTTTVCKTNLPSNTAFRGFGAPQATFAVESIMDHIARHLNMPPHELRQQNFLSEGDAPIYGKTLDPEDNNVRKCWDECVRDSKYFQKLNDIQQFNKSNQWKKRGIALQPHIQGIGTYTWYCQSSALVHIYTDGSVLVTHGGIEMGQGLNTKMIQVASRCLEVPMTKIHITETSTDKIPNAMVTAGSSSSDLYGHAVMKACEELRSRLEPIMKANPESSWEEWISKAFFSKISLSATGYYNGTSRTHDNTGREYFYHLSGTSCTEVEVDCLTGQTKVLDCHIVMDIGESMNPAIDIGQVQGGWLQGYGLNTMEEVLVSPTGESLCPGFTFYKIPALPDMPTNFTVSFLRGSSNPRAVYSSKGMGEPPLLMAVSAFLAIKSAIAAARAQHGLHGPFRMDSPATCERIRMLCQDKFTEMAKENVNEETQYNVEV